MLLRTPVVMAAFLGFFGLFLVDTAAAADFSSELIERGRRATVLVIGKSGRVFGSAFCIDGSGLFVTNAHVVGDQTGEQTTLVLHSGGRQEQLVHARIVRVDRQRDLALLHAAEATNLTSLTLGDDAKLFETQSVAAFGYPYGTALAVIGKHPSISVNVGRVTALRRQDDALQRIQFDAQVNPGNSGGPLVDDRGNVIGVVASGIVNSGVYMAIPVSELRAWLRDPVILVEPREIPFDRRHDKIQFTIRVVTAGQKLRPERVEFSLGNDGRLRRSEQAKGGDNGKYVVTMQPTPPPAENRSVQVSAQLEDGYIRGYTSNPTLKIGDREIALSDLRQIQRDGEQWRITTSKEEEFTADTVPTIKLTIALDDAVKAAVELRRISQLVVYPPSTITRVNYHVAVSFADADTAVQRGEISFVGSGAVLAAPAAVSAVPTAGRAPPEQAAAVEMGCMELKLPAKYTSFAVGGHGRYLIFQLAEQNKALVFDITAGRVVHELTGISSGDLLTAGANKFFVVSPDKMMVQRWSLTSFQREEVARIEGGDAPVAVHLGSASQGPLLLRSKTAQLLDAKSLRPLASKERVIGAAAMHRDSMQVSADGRSFAGFVSESGPVSYEVMQLRASRRVFVSFGGSSQAIRWAQPTADGTLLLLPGGEVFNANGRQIQATWLEGGTSIPSADPSLFVDVRLAAERPDGKKSTKLTVCTVADCRPIYTEWGFDELTPQRINSWFDIVGALRCGHQWRLQYAPWTNAIVTLPADNQRILLRPFDLEAKLNAENRKYLYLQSTPPVEAIKGQAMRYRIQARSNGGDLDFALEDGPQGAVVSPDGAVVWDAPSSYSEPWARFIILVRDKSAQEILHSFEVAVRDSR